MIFENGELRPIASNKPMLFEGWDYIPIELDLAATDTQGVRKEEMAQSDISKAFASK